MKMITFGSHDNYIDAGKRLIMQSKSMNIFNESILYTPQDLGSEFCHEEFINNNKRGYGYWLWKPFIIKKTMDTMIDGDVLLYLDCGCELDSKNKNLLHYINIVKTDKIIGTLAGIEKDWTKMDLIQKIGIKYQDVLTSQHAAGAILFLVCPETRQLVNEWYTIGCDYHNIDDSPSILKNISGFKEHRHDQSIYSLLTKKYNLYSNHNLHNAVCYNRNRSGVSHIRA
jgi:hypothetical protein